MLSIFIETVLLEQSIPPTSSTSDKINDWNFKNGFWLTAISHTGKWMRPINKFVGNFSSATEYVY